MVAEAAGRAPSKTEERTRHPDIPPQHLFPQYSSAISGCHYVNIQETHQQMR